MVHNKVTSLEDELISLAYAMALEPHQFDRLVSLLDERLDKQVYSAERSIDEGSDKHLDKVLENHFQRALKLIERQGHRVNGGIGSIKHLESDHRPSAIISINGTIEYVNDAARSCLKWLSGQQVTASVFEEGHFQRFMQDLARLDHAPADQFFDIYNLVCDGSESGEHTRVALSKSVNAKGESVARLSTIQLNWSSEIGAQFKKSFGLTSVELEITQAVVNGSSMAELAKLRHRSVATLHTQLKSLLTKLELRSKVELACLYSGFAQFSLLRPLPKDYKLTPGQETNLDSEIFTCTDGREIEYACLGSKKGEPVVFFHALLGGISFPAEMQKYVQDYNLRMIMPWRPSFAASSGYHNHKTAAADFAKDIEQLLDHLGIQRCQFLAHISGSVFAYSAAVRCAERVSQIVVASGAVPLSKSHLKSMRLLQRTSLSLARYTPKLLPLLMRVALAKVDLGFDEEMWREYYRDSKCDRDFMSDDQMRSLMRDAYSISTQQGDSCILQEVTVMAQRWTEILHSVSCPVTIFQGSHDPSFSPQIVTEATAGLTNINVVCLQDAGQLLLYQQPRKVLGALAKNRAS